MFQDRRGSLDLGQTISHRLFAMANVYQHVGLEGALQERSRKASFPSIPQACFSLELFPREIPVGITEDTLGEALDQGSPTGARGPVLAACFFCRPHG